MSSGRKSPRPHGSRTLLASFSAPVTLDMLMTIISIANSEFTMLAKYDLVVSVKRGAHPPISKNARASCKVLTFLCPSMPFLGFTSVAA